MSDPDEQSERTQQETRSTQAITEGRAEATEAAARKAQELGVDLTNVEGTGSGGRVTAPDVDNAYRQTNTTTMSEEASQPVQRGLSRERVSQPVQGDPCDQAPCEPIVLGPTDPCCTGPDQEAILEQYVILTATLAGPTGDVNLSQDIAVKVNPDGTVTQFKQVIETDFGRIKKINFPGAGTPFACSFFAPMPPSAPVNWPFPTPQPLLVELPSCLTPCQDCLDEKCEPCGPSPDSCLGDVELAVTLGACNRFGTKTVIFKTELEVKGTETIQARWNFGDGTTGDIFSIPPASNVSTGLEDHTEPHDYSHPGTYHATLELLPAGCPDSIGQCVTVETCQPATATDH